MQVQLLTLRPIYNIQEYREKLDLALEKRTIFVRPIRPQSGA